jgi:hypothetical protein
MTVCGIAQLALDLFDQNFPPPLRAVTFDDVSCTSITMALSGVVTDTDSHIRVERANRYGTTPSRLGVVGFLRVSFVW